MESFAGRIAVVTGGGTGMGRELVRQLSAEGCHVALCDVNADTMAETKALAEKEAPPGTRIRTFVADVSDETQVLAFRDHVVAELDTTAVHLVFNNATSGVAARSSPTTAGRGTAPSGSAGAASTTAAGRSFPFSSPPTAAIS